MRYRKENGQWKEVTPLGVSREEFDEVKQDLTNNHYTKTEVDNFYLPRDITGIVTKSSVVEDYKASVIGKMLSLVVKFTPTVNGQVLISNLPTPLQARFYSTVFNFNNGVPVDGGAWIDGRTLTYYGVIPNTTCVTQIIIPLS